MTKQTEEALKMAIEWVEGWKGIAPSKIELLRVLREALEQPAQEPINLNCKSVQKRLATQWGYVKQYAQEPAPSWQGLNNDRIREIGEQCELNNNGTLNWIDFARAIEQALKEKNT